MWQSLFETIGKAFDFFGGLIKRKQSPDMTPSPPLDDEDPQAARAGAAAGAAANEASHIAGPPKNP